MLCLTHLTTSDRTPDDALSLPFDLRQKCLQRVRLASGTEAAVMLPRGSTLRAGQVLRPEDDSLHVLVKAADESLSVVSCTDPLLLARVCYHLGNRHVTVQIDPGSVSYLHDHVLDDMVRGLGLTVAHARRPFEPESGAYTPTGDHDHSH